MSTRRDHNHRKHALENLVTSLIDQQARRCHFVTDERASKPSNTLIAWFTLVQELSLGQSPVSVGTSRSARLVRISARQPIRCSLAFPKRERATRRCCKQDIRCRIVVSVKYEMSVDSRQSLGVGRNIAANNSDIHRKLPMPTRFCLPI